MTQDGVIKLVQGNQLPQYDIRDAEADEGGVFIDLKRLRVAAGLSQDDLARLSGVPIRMIQHYEQRVKSINRAAYETVAQLAQALHCRPEVVADVDI